MNEDDLEQLELLMPLTNALVITRRNGKVNLCPINYQVVSTKYELPLTVCIGLSNTSFSLENILETKEFVLAYPSREQLEDTIHCGTISGRDTDKLAQTRFEMTPAEKIPVPQLKGAVINLECQLQQTIKQDTFTIVIAKVVALKGSEKQALDEQSSPSDKTYALGHQSYGTIKELSIDQIGRK